MIPADPPAFHDDLILRTRPGLNIRTGRTETRYWIDAFGGSARGVPFVSRADALAAGRVRAEAEQVTFWEDVTSVTCPSHRKRMEVSFRAPTNPAAER